MKVIFNAVDFGISKAASLGIIEAHKNGVIKSTTLMCNMKDADYAADLAKNNKNLGVGIHLVMTAGAPLCKDVLSLVDENGMFKKNDVVMNTATIEDVTNISKESAESAKAAAVKAKGSAENAGKSREDMLELSQAMERITETSREIENII